MGQRTVLSKLRNFSCLKLFSRISDSQLGLLDQGAFDV